jgi:hypothetical protein
MADRYLHAIRYFGLLAPATKRTTAAALLILLKQKKRRRPQRFNWEPQFSRIFTEILFWIG